MITTIAALLMPLALTAGAPIAPHATHTAVSTRTKAARTRAVTTLTPVVGNLVITKAGTVVDHIDLTGRIIVKAPRVTIKNSSIHGRVKSTTGPAALVDVRDPRAVGTVIQGNTIRPSAAVVSQYANGIDGHDFTATGNNISDVNDGIRVRNGKDGQSHTFIKANYIHDFAYVSPAGPQLDNQTHNDGVQLAGAQGVVITGNTIAAFYGPAGTSQPKIDTGISPSGWRQGVALAAIQFSPSGGPSGTATVDGNRLLGGRTAINTGHPDEAGTDLGSFTHNRFSRQARRAPRIMKSQTATVYGNTWDDGTHAPIIKVTS